MNPIQKQLLVYGAAAMLAMVVFPPWTRITQHVTPAFDKSAVQTETQESAGYAWLFEPPKTTSQTAWGFGYYQSVRIDVGRLLLQWATVAFVLVAALMYFKDSDTKSLGEWWSAVSASAKSRPTSDTPKPMAPDSPNSESHMSLHAALNQAEKALRQARPISETQVPTDVGSNKASESTLPKHMSPWERALKPAEAAFGIGVVAGIASAIPVGLGLLFDGFMAVFAGLLLAVPTYLVTGLQLAAKGERRTDK